MDSEVLQKSSENSSLHRESKKNQEHFWNENTPRQEHYSLDCFWGTQNELPSLTDDSGARLETEIRVQTQNVLSNKPVYKENADEQVVATRRPADDTGDLLSNLSICSPNASTNSHIENHGPKHNITRIREDLEPLPQRQATVLRTAKISLFDFDEDDLLDDDCDAQKKISFHQNEIETCITEGFWTKELFTHLQAVIEQYGLISDLRLVIYLGLFYLVDQNWKSGQQVLSKFKLDSSIGPAHNLSAYILRAQASYHLKEYDTALKDCRRSIALAERLQNSKYSSSRIERFINLATSIASECSAKMSLESDRLYFRSKCGRNQRSPVLTIGTLIVVKIEFSETASAYHIVTLPPYGIDWEDKWIRHENSRELYKFRGQALGISIMTSLVCLKDQERLKEKNISVDETMEISWSGRKVLRLLFVGGQFLSILEFCLRKGYDSLGLALCSSQSPILYWDMLFQPKIEVTLRPERSRLVDNRKLTIRYPIEFLSLFGDEISASDQEWDAKLASSMIHSLLYHLDAACDKQPSLSVITTDYGRDNYIGLALNVARAVGNHTLAEKILLMELPPRIKSSN